MSAIILRNAQTWFRVSILHCNYGETVDSPGEGAERVELA